MRHLRGTNAAIVGLGVLVFMLYVATASHGFPDSDVLSADAFAWHLVHTGRPWADGLTDAQLAPWKVSQLWLTSHGGHTVISRSPGVLVAGLPAYAIDAMLHRGSGTHLSAAPGAITGAACAALAVVLLLLACRDRLPRRALIGAGAAIALTTPFWSVLGNGLWTHDLTVPGIAGMAWAARRERWWLVGVFGGIGLWGRLHVAVIVALLGLGLAVWRRRPAIAVAVGATSVPFLLLAGLWSHWLYGHWTPSGGYAPTSVATTATGMALGSRLENLAGLLVSPGRGLLIWTPALLVLAPAVVRGWRSTPDWTRLLALGGLVYLVVQGSIDGFTGGSGFYGYRLTLETIACWIPLWLWSAPAAGTIARRLLGWVLGLQLAAISVGAIGEGAFISYDVAWRDNSFWLAVRTSPGWMILYTVVAVLTTVLVTRMLGLRARRTETVGGHI